MTPALAPLRLPGFRSLFVARFANEVGYWFGAVALAVLVYDETKSAIATTGLFLAMEFLPALIAPALVARVDRVQPRLSLGLVYVTEAVTFVLIAVVAESFLLPAIIALAAVDGTLALAARALTRATAATLLQPVDQLRAGNALLNVGFTAAAAGAPAVAGLVIAASGEAVAFLVAAASFLAIGATLGATRSLPRAPRGEDQADRAAPVRARLRAGLRLVRGERVLRALFSGQAIAFIFFSAVLPIEVVYAKEALAVGDAGYGALLTCWGVGMVLGSLVFAIAGRVSLRALLGVGTLAIGGAYLAMGVAGTLVLACVAAVVGGLGNGVQWVALTSAVQELTPPAFQARLMGLLESTAAGVTAVGFILGGAVAAAVDPRTSFVVAGLGVVAVVIVAGAVLRRLGWRGDAAGHSERRPGSMERGRPADSLATP